MFTAQEIVQALRKRGLTQIEIQRRTGIPQARLSRWASGSVPVGADDALRLKALHEDLVGADGAASVPAKDDARDAA